MAGKQEHIRSDNGAGFTARPVMRWLRDELLNREWFRTLAKAKVLNEAWRHFYNERRPHSAQGYQSPAAVRRAWSDTDNIIPRLTA